MRITVVTQKGSRYGLKLLNLLRWNHTPVEQVVTLSVGWRHRLRWLRRTARRIGWADTLAYTAARRFGPPFARQGPNWRGCRLERDYRSLARRVDETRGPRTPATLDALRRGRPDLCLLAQSEIVPAALLTIPRVATLNAHPGVLPDYRGLDPDRWAIYEGRFDRVGVTLHVVDPGIDTGPILEVHPYRWTGDETLDRLAWRLNERCLDLLAGACGAPWPATLEKARPQEGGRLHHAFPPRLRPDAERKLATHLARRRGSPA